VCRSKIDRYVLLRRVPQRVVQGQDWLEVDRVNLVGCGASSGSLAEWVARARDGARHLISVTALSFVRQGTAHLPPTLVSEDDAALLYRS
jgi:hypothetical protein